jgi:hypothetical protein
MRRLAVVLVVVACGSSHDPIPPKKPNNELIIDTFERRPPNGTTAMRFRADGTVDVAHAKDKLDLETLAHGTWQLDKDQLTLTYETGMCAGSGPGVYQVVLSKLGIHFKKVSDDCAQRAKLDGEVWRRAP